MNRLLFGTLLIITSACYQEKAIQPSSSLVGEAVGTYQTNAYLDVANVALPTYQLPYAELRKESDSSLTLLYTQVYPQKKTFRLHHVSLIRLADTIQLRVADTSIGTLQNDRIFLDNGMEKQGQRLRLSVTLTPSEIVTFTGSRP